jgi:hypothetical protein
MVIRSHQATRKFKLSLPWMSRLAMDSLFRSRLLRNLRMLINCKSSQPWKKL